MDISADEYDVARRGAGKMAIATFTKTDQQIQQDVMNELKWDARLQPNEIGVIVKNGIVTLTGWVDSYLKKWTAEDVAHRVSGVKAVANDIEVKLASERTDPDIAAAAIHAATRFATEIVSRRMRRSAL